MKNLQEEMGTGGDPERSKANRYAVRISKNQAGADLEKKKSFIALKCGCHLDHVEGCRQP